MYASCPICGYKLCKGAASLTQNGENIYNKKRFYSTIGKKCGQLLRNKAAGGGNLRPPPYVCNGSQKQAVIKTAKLFNTNGILPR